jgi:hypothetical protein
MRCDCLGGVKQLRFYFLYTAFLRTDFLSGGGAIRHHISRNGYFTSHWICLIPSYVWDWPFEAASERILAFPCVLLYQKCFARNNVQIAVFERLPYHQESPDSPERWFGSIHWVYLYLMTFGNGLESCCW